MYVYMCVLFEISQFKWISYQLLYNIAAYNATSSLVYQMSKLVHPSISGCSTQLAPHVPDYNRLGQIKPHIMSSQYMFTPADRPYYRV